MNKDWKKLLGSLDMFLAGKVEQQKTEIEPLRVKLKLITIDFIS